MCACIRACALVGFVVSRFCAELACASDSLSAPLSLTYSWRRGCALACVRCACLHACVRGRFVRHRLSATSARTTAAASSTPLTLACRCADFQRSFGERESRNQQTNPVIVVVRLQLWLLDGVMCDQLESVHVVRIQHLSSNTLHR